MPEPTGRTSPGFPRASLSIRIWMRAIAFWSRSTVSHFIKRFVLRMRTMFYSHILIGNVNYNSQPDCHWTITRCWFRRSKTCVQGWRKWRLWRIDVLFLINLGRPMSPDDHTEGYQREYFDHDKYRGIIIPFMLSVCNCSIFYVFKFSNDVDAVSRLL